MLLYERDSVLSDQWNDRNSTQRNDVVFRHQLNDRNSAQRNDVVFRHPELDSGSQALCYFTSEIPY